MSQSRSVRRLSRHLLLVTLLACGLTLLLAAGLPRGPGTEAEARMMGFRVPRMSVPRMTPGRTLRIPRTPSLSGKSLMTPKKLPGTGTALRSFNKPIMKSTAAKKLLQGNAARKLTSQPTAAKQAKSAATKGNSDRWGWSDCRSRGGVWGANASCGHPNFPGASGGSGAPTAGRLPRLALIPWFVPIAPTLWVDPLPCPQGYVNVGTFYGGSKCVPQGSYVAANPDPPPPPPPSRVASDDDCMRARAGTPFFGIPGNPDPAAVKEACEAEKREPVALAGGDLPPPPQAPPIVAAAPPPPPPPPRPPRLVDAPRPIQKDATASKTSDEDPELQYYRWLFKNVRRGDSANFDKKLDQYYIWGRIFQRSSLLREKIGPMYYASGIYETGKHISEIVPSWTNKLETPSNPQLQHTLHIATGLVPNPGLPPSHSSYIKGMSSILRGISDERHGRGLPAGRFPSRPADLPYQPPVFE